MGKENTQFNQTEEVEVTVSEKSTQGDNDKLQPEKNSKLDANKYKKRWVDNLDRRFLSIFLATLVFNVILILYISHIPFQITADYIKNFQEHYANFVYDKQGETVDVEDSGDKALVGEGEGDEKEKQEETKDQGEGGGEGKSEGVSPAGPGTGETTAEARRAAHTKSTQEIQQEVSNKGLLGLLTGIGSAAQGEAIQDVLSSSAGGGSGNLDDVLSGLSGIKTQGAPGGSGSGSGGARGSRTTGSGTGIGDMIDGLTNAKSQNFGKKTDEMVVSESKVEIEGGKAGGRDPESVMAVVNSHRAAIEYCYQRALRKNPNLKGKISLRFTISPAGQVKNVEIISNTLNDSSVERCIISKIKSWRDFGPVDPSKGDAVFRQDYIFGY